MVKTIKEALRYLGYRGQEPDLATLRLVETCMEELEGQVQRRSLWERYPLTVAGSQVQLGPLRIQSGQLARHLEGCSQALLFAATLGVGADRLVQKYEKLDLTRAVALQACGASLIEAYCDRCQRELARLFEGKDLFLRPRFSPGYGDFSLEYQQDLLNLLQCPQRIGLTCTKALMLLPTKSVTAVIGLARESARRDCRSRCGQCQSENCPFREEETP